MKIPIPDNPQHVENLCSIPLLKAQGFEGMDASLEISLFEYNLAWRDLGEEYLIIYSLPSARAFDRCTMRKDLDIKKEYNWVNFEEVASFIGVEDLEEWFTIPLPHKLNDLINYYGSLEIFGTSYWEGFKIEKE